MGLGQLRSKRQDFIAQSQTISSSQESRSIDIGSTEDAIAIQMVWSAGSSVNMQVSLEVSNDNTNFVEIPSTVDTLSTDTGVYMWDLRTGAEYIRVKFVVTSGQADFTISLNAKSR